eukprot:g1868.t1
MVVPEIKVVCVTGASGFIGSHIVQQLLQGGYTVRACVRDAANEAKTAHLRACASEAGAADRLSFHSADLLKDGTFDEAVAGADAVIHTAAVVLVTASDPQRTIIDPSIRGTRNLLGAIARAPRVRRLVHTSSVAAVHTHTEGGASKVYTEADYNTAAAGTDPYGFAKLEAERMAQAAAEDSGGRWDVAVMNPGLCLGPCMTKAHTKASPVFLRQLLFGNKQPRVSFPIVDVRDVASAHVRALALPGGDTGWLGRHILSSGTELFTEELGQAVQQLYPALKVDTGYLGCLMVWFAALNPFITRVTVHMARHVFNKPFRYSNARATKQLAVEWHTASSTLRATVDSMIDTGFVKPRRRKGAAAASERTPLVAADAEKKD